MNIFLGLSCVFSGIIGLYISFFAKGEKEVVNTEQRKEDTWFSKKSEFEHKRQGDVGIVVFGIFLMFLLRQNSFFAPASLSVICIMCFLGLFNLGVGFYDQGAFKGNGVIVSTKGYFRNPSVVSGLVFLVFALISGVWAVILYLK